MNDKILISVIVPLYNKEPWVERCIRSILAQTYQNFEILVINDGSTDGSRKVLEAIDDPRIRIIDKLNGGVSSARNMGIKKAEGKYIAFVDADDEWRTKHLEVLLEGFYKSEDVVLVCSDLMETTDGKKENQIKRKLPFKFPEDGKIHYAMIEDYLQTLKDNYFILSASSVLIKLSVIKEHQLKFFEVLTHGEDINFWLQLHHLGKFIFCDYLGLYYHRADENSAMNQTIRDATLVPPFFYKIDFKSYNMHDQKDIRKFLYREYLKTAYQNRGLPLRKEELSTLVGGGIEIGRYSSFMYLLIRFAPQWIFSVKKYLNSLKKKGH